MHYFPRREIEVDLRAAGDFPFRPADPVAIQVLMTHVEPDARWRRQNVNGVPKEKRDE